MKISTRTTFRIVRWALSSMPSTPWLMACTICTKKFVRARRDSVRPWIPSTEASCWIICSRRLSEESQGKTFISTKTETPQAGERREEIELSYDSQDLNSSPLSHSHGLINARAQARMSAHQSWAQRVVISLDWNRFSDWPTVAATFIFFLVQQTPFDSQEMQPCHFSVRWSTSWFKYRNKDSVYRCTSSLCHMIKVFKPY